jgi:hypothetical protein
MATFRIGDEVNTRYGPAVIVEVHESYYRVQLERAKAILRVEEWAITPRQPVSGAATNPARLNGFSMSRSVFPKQPPPRTAPQPKREQDPFQSGAVSRKAGAEVTPDRSSLPPPISTASRIGTSSGSRAKERMTKRRTKRFEPSHAAKTRRAVEALRFGLVPTVWLEELTIGYGRLEAWTTSLLPSANDHRPIAAEISGPFGTGKSHACAVVRSIASQHGYLIANVEVDGLRVSMSEPSLLWHAISRTVTANGLTSSTPIVDIYLRAMGMDSRGLHTTRDADGLFSRDAGWANFEAVRTAVEHGVLESIATVLEDHLSSNPQLPAGQVKTLLRAETGIPAERWTLMPVIGRGVLHRSADFVRALTALALAGQMAGFAGLVITVDEFEVEYHLTNAKIQRIRDLVDELARYVAGASGYASAPIALFFASVGQDGHRGDRIIEHLVEAGQGSRFDLEPMDAERRRMLAERIHKMYLDAYSIEAEFNQTLVDAVETSLVESGDIDSSGVARAFIKRYVAALDALHGPPNA